MGAPMGPGDAQQPWGSPPPPPAPGDPWTQPPPPIAPPPPMPPPQQWAPPQPGQAQWTPPPLPSQPPPGQAAPPWVAQQSPASFQRAMPGPYAQQRRGSLFQSNTMSFSAVGVSVVYLVIALSTGFVFFGIMPVMMTVRAFQRREPLRLIGAAAAALAVLVTIFAFAG